MDTQVTCTAVAREVGGMVDLEIHTNTGAALFSDLVELDGTVVATATGRLDRAGWMVTAPWKQDDATWRATVERR